MDAELLAVLVENNYRNLREINGRGACGLLRMAYTVGLFYGLNKEYYEGRYCFETWAEAEKSLNEWDGNGEPSGDWIKHKGVVGEWANPNIEK